MLDELGESDVLFSFLMRIFNNYIFDHIVHTGRR